MDPITLLTDQEAFESFFNSIPVDVDNFLDRMESQDDTIELIHKSTTDADE